MGNLASAVDELLAVDAHQVSSPVRQELVEEIVRQRHRLDAAYLALVEAEDRSGVAAEQHGSIQAWLRNTFRLASNVAYRDVRLARTLADVLPLTAAALRDGDISVEHVVQVAALRRSITDFALTQVEHHVVAMARERDPQRLRKGLAHIKDAYAPDKSVKARAGPARRTVADPRHHPRR